MGVHPQGGDDGGGGCKLWVYTHRGRGDGGGWWVQAVGVHPNTFQVGFQDKDLAKRSTNSMVLGGKYAKILMFISSKRSIRNGASC